MLADYAYVFVFITNFIGLSHFASPNPALLFARRSPAVKVILHADTRISPQEKYIHFVHALFRYCTAPGWLPVGLVVDMSRSISRSAYFRSFLQILFEKLMTCPHCKGACSAPYFLARHIACSRLHFAVFNALRSSHLPTHCSDWLRI